MNNIKQNTLVLGKGFLGKCFERNEFNVKTRSFFDVFDFVDDYDLLINTEEFQNADVIINCISICDTRWCEQSENWPKIQIINGLFPGALSVLCKIHGKKFVQVSTGCLYDKTDGLKDEHSLIETHCRYTVSKAIGEFNCNTNRDLILRPRLLFDNINIEGKNLLSKFYKFNTYLNEFNTFCSNQTLVDATKALLENDCIGIFNVGNTGTYTTKQLAESIGFKSNGSMKQNDLIKSEGLYLVNCVMDLSKLMEYFIPRDAIDEAKHCVRDWDI